MIIVDSSIWIDHLRGSLSALRVLLLQQQVVQHPMVTAEIMLGSVTDRLSLQTLLSRLPQIAPCSPEYLLDFTTQQRVYGTGIGVVDVYLLAAAIQNGHHLWSRDKRLAAQASKLGCLANID